MDYAKESLHRHYQWRGKIEIKSRVPIETKEDLSLAYTPGVAEPCLRIHKDAAESYALTRRSDLVAIVTDGSAVLGLGDIGPEAAMPVMEGKAVLFKELGGVDAVPLCIRSRDTDEIVNTVRLLSGSFGGINLEDISSPRCFEIERRLKECCDIPVFHDDQHGTAVVALAAVLNALRITGKKRSGVSVVINGAGAGGTATARLLLDCGIGGIILCDRKGAIYKGRDGINSEKQQLAEITNPECRKGTLSDIIKGSDIFIGLSSPGCVTQEMVKSMNKDPVIFAMANPIPEIMPDLAKTAGACIVGTGRSDFPNQINNALAFPGIFRGALNARADDINEAMKIAAAGAIAGFVGDDLLSTDHIVPSPLDRAVAASVAEAVEEAAAGKMHRKIHEECAVLGVSLLNDEAAGITYNGLLTLQHRGQEGAGIAVVTEGNIICKKDKGLVSEVFAKEELASLFSGRTAIGHTRYSTTGGSLRENTGPFVTEYLTGRIATAHNGNITNAKSLRKMLEDCGLRFKSTSDSEVVASLLAYRIVKEKNIMKGIEKAVGELEGAFSLCIATADGHLFAVRDPHGFRPLCLGKSKNGIIAASESCALEACDFEFLRDVKPGETVLMINGEVVNSVRSTKERKKNTGLCIFEYVYFARPDSVIDGLSVYEARFNMGKILAEEHPAEADIVCGVPDSGVDAAIGYASASGLPLVNGFVKNRYIGRSFIYPTQDMRSSAVRLKLNPLRAGIEGKRVVLVDDSIVRGTTSEKIIRNLKAAGAKEVHFRISSPPFMFTCRYGTDIDSMENLIANRMSMDEICRKIGANSLGYISMDGLKKACGKCAISFCSACFTGESE